MRNYINWLRKHSLLYAANKIIKRISGKNVLPRSYIEPQTDAITKKASVWFSCYSSAMITKPRQKILPLLRDKKLWQALQAIGVKALYPGPMELAGGLKGYQHTPSVDGWFDRIHYQIDPTFGKETDYRAMVKMAKKHAALIIGDIIPAQTGRGADFFLAVRNYKGYPGIYVMVPIRKRDWHLLPQVDDIHRSANLSPEQVAALTKKHYIPGDLEELFYSNPDATEPETGWDATAPIVGVDGKERRWVYLHYFRPEQPTMNWTDPSFTANRIISADIIKNIIERGATILRIDCNIFLNIEYKPESLIAWSQRTPLAIEVTNTLAWLIRHLGGYSFEELDADFIDVRDFIRYGPDLSYDFITRPAVQHALLTGSTTFLHLNMELAKQFGIKPNNLIHDLQNHDEITYILDYFRRNPERVFNYAGKKLTALTIRNLILKQMEKAAIGPKTPYNRVSGNGLSATFTGLVTSRLRIKDIYHLTPKQKEAVKKGHLLLAMFNAMQPGVFGISGWDLVGALPLEPEKIKKQLADGDYRWVNRGAYDLMGYNEKAKASHAGVPRAHCLYGHLPKQLKNPKSFASQIRHMLRVREKFGIAYAEQIALPPVKHKGTIIIVYKLPNNFGYQIMALNFGKNPAIEVVDLGKILAIEEKLTGKKVENLLTKAIDSKVSAKNTVTIKLAVLEGKVLRIAKE